MGVPFLGNPYAKTITEYPVPTPPPGVGPSNSPTVNLAVSCYWLPYIAGACKAFLQEATWKTSSQAELIQALGWGADLLDIISLAMESSACDSLGPTFACPYPFEFSDEGWYPDDWIGCGGCGCSADRGLWLYGSGWQNSAQYCSNSNQTFYAIDIIKDLSPAVTLTDIIVDCSLTKGTCLVPGVNNLITASYLGSTVATFSQAYDTRPDGPGSMDVSFAAALVDQIRVQLIADVCSGMGASTGVCRITEIDIQGTGSKPC